jgi:uncharacterized protein (TIGR02594 family)
MRLKTTTRALLLCSAALTIHTPANADPSKRERSFFNVNIEASDRSGRKRLQRPVAKRDASHSRRHGQSRQARVSGVGLDRHSVEGDNGFSAMASVGHMQPVQQSRGAVGIAAPAGSSLISEARRWLGTNPTGRASQWCATFMNFVLERTGRRGTGSDMARSFASYGQRVSGPQIGAIAVLTRGKNGGHVGVVTGIDESGNPILISGNHNRTVAEAPYPRSRIYAYVMPK